MLVLISLLFAKKPKIALNLQYTNFKFVVGSPPALIKSTIKRSQNPAIRGFAACYLHQDLYLF